MANFFARTLLKWHRDNPRPMPWSVQKPDPYHVWISEIILQQTRVSQGTDYFLRFVRMFPTIESLAFASMDDVMRLWQGLGYYTRARNLHKAAKHIVEVFGGQFPGDYDSILTLPGIGPYSASAISSFAFGGRHAVVDGNVKRVIARFSGITQSIDDASVYEQIRKIALGFMADVSPAVFNQAIMNFGALVCKPKLALCEECPLSKRCYAFQHHLVETLPVRSKKKLNRHRYFHFIVFHFRDKILLQRREEKDIWRGLYTPPLLERNSERIPSGVRIRSFANHKVGHDQVEIIKTTSPVRQLLSHQTIVGRFTHIRLLAPPLLVPEEHTWASKKNVQDLAKPKMVAELFSGK